MPSSLCPLPNSELLLNTIVSGLLSEGRMPAGSLLDAGAHMGRWACYYATAARSRKVWALEPVATNVEHMRSYYVPSLPNLRPMHGALGSEAKTVDSGLRPAGIRTQIGGVHRMRGVDHRQRPRVNLERHRAQIPAVPRDSGTRGGGRARIDVAHAAQRDARAAARVEHRGLEHRA